MAKQKLQEIFGTNASEQNFEISVPAQYKEKGRLRQGRKTKKLKEQF
jgi:hypothetical protein